MYRYVDLLYYNQRILLHVLTTNFGHPQGGVFLRKMPLHASRHYNTTCGWMVLPYFMALVRERIIHTDYKHPIQHK
jgi:hypothetical protein